MLHSGGTRQCQAAHRQTVRLPASARPLCRRPPARRPFHIRARLSMASARPLEAVTVLEDIMKSSADNKQYRYVVFDNQLTCLLIHDPEMNKSSADGAPQDQATRRHEDEGSGDDVESDEDEGASDSDSEMHEGEDSSGSEEGSESEGEGEEGESEEGSPGARKRGQGGGAAEGVKKAAAALSVGVGSFCDPLHMQGLSHYLEHMLFMGSGKYPSENEYDDFISKHGGTSNAFTELESTNYHFEVSPDALQGALDRFAQFFISPLMLEGSLEREVLAVDSEFSGVMQSDSCRASQLMCHTAVPGHTYRKFSWGNKKSLWDQPRAASLDVRQQIRDYYDAQYSAERMSLVVLGGEPLGVLQSWVAEAFQGLPTGKGPRPAFTDMPRPFKGRSVYVMPSVREHHEVSITFQLPCMCQHYPAKAEHYVSHLVGHEGPGSLHSYLKARGWATEVLAGIDDDGYSQNSGVFLFTLTITLTEAGLSAGPGGGLAAVEAAFQYLRMLRETGPQEWVWREMASIADIKFKFQEEEEAMDTCTKLASQLHLCQPQHVLCADYLHEHWRPDLVTQVLDAMHPNRCDYRVDVITAKYQDTKSALSQLGHVTEDTEPWFNFPAAWVQIPDSVTSSWETCSLSPELHLPPANPYIATDFTLRALTAVKGQTAQTPETLVAAAQQEATALAQEQGLPVVLATPPKLIKDGPGLRVWHKLDRTFNTPRANVYMRLSSPTWHESPRSAALTYLGLKLLEDTLNKDAYLAEVAGLHYGVAPEGLQGVEIKLDGFNHKLPVLAHRILSVLAEAQFTGASWPTVHEAACRKYKNMNMQVSKHATYERLYVLCARALHSSLVEEHVRSATLTDVQSHVKEVLKRCHLEVLCHGNMTSDEALHLSASCTQLLGSGCVGEASERTRDCCVALPTGPGLLVTRPTRNSEEENCGVEVYYQVGVARTCDDRALVDLVDQMVYEPAYNRLRTQLQLGYTVHSGSRLTLGVIGFCFVVVSSSHTAPTVTDKVEEFLTEFGNSLGDMSEADFTAHKASLRANKLSRDRALLDETVRHWDHIWNERYEFLAREQEVKALETVTLQQVKEWWSQHMSVKSKTRRRLAVHIVPTKTCKAHSAVSAAPQGAGASKRPRTSGPLTDTPGVDDLKSRLEKLEMPKTEPGTVTVAS